MPAAPPHPLRLLWLTLPETRPGRELGWLAAMPEASVTAVVEVPTGDPAAFVQRPYRRLTRRFVEAGALAWFRDLGSVAPDGGTDWVGALELCALVTGQVPRLADRLGARRVVITWGNDPRNPLYRLPPYRQALARSRSSDLVICTIEAALDHCLALGIAEDRCRVVLPPVDTERFHPPTEPVEEPVALFVSPLAENKGIDRVLDAVLPELERTFQGSTAGEAGLSPRERLICLTHAFGGLVVNLGLQLRAEEAKRYWEAMVRMLLEEGGRNEKS